MVIEEKQAFIRHESSFDTTLERLYTAYLENDFSALSVSPDYAAGLHEFLNLPFPYSLAVKGQVVGPLSFGVLLKDESKQSILHDDILLDSCARLLRLKAAWQENELRRLNTKTIIFIDEPIMASFGSAYFSISPEKVAALLGEVLGGISGLRGIHCCGNTDWSILCGLETHIISFDTYNYASSLALYASDVKSLIQRGGAIAWGIVPNNAESLQKENVVSLKDRLEDAMAPFTRHGIGIRQLKEQSLLTPSCGLAGLSEEEAEQALELLATLASHLRKSI